MLLGGMPLPLAGAVPSPKAICHVVATVVSELCEPSKLTARGARPDKGVAMSTAFGGSGHVTAQVMAGALNVATWRKPAARARLMVSRPGVAGGCSVDGMVR